VFLLRLKVLSSHKRDGSRVISIGRLYLATQSRMFFDTLKGIVLCFKFEKPDKAFSLNEGGVFLMWSAYQKLKNSEAHEEIALLLLVAIGGVG
jgi:hypothetical protein